MTLIAALTLALSQAPFAGDAKLDEAISYRHETTSIRKVLAEIQTMTGAELRAAPAIAEDLIVIRFKDRPAHEVLARIAKHFDWEWTKAETGYLLAAKPGWDVRERLAVENEIFKTMSPAVEKARADLRSATEPARARARMAELNREISALEDSIGDEEEYDDATWVKIRTLSRERAALRLSIAPDRRMVNELVASFDKPTLLEMARRGRLVFSVVPTASQRRMPASATNAAQRFVNELAEITRQGLADEEFDWETSILYPGRVRFEPSDIATVRMSVAADAGEIASRGRWYARADIAVIDKRGGIVWTDTTSIGDYAYSAYSDYEYPEEMDEEMDEEEEEPPREPRGPIDAFPQKLGDFPEVVEAFRSMAGMELPPAQLIESMKKGSDVDSLAAMNRILVLAADAADCSLIGDAYDTLTMAWRTEPGETLGASIDSFAYGADSHWTFENEWIAVRNDQPEIARARSVPRPILRKYRDLIAEQLGLTADQLAQMALDLTDLQLSSGSTQMFMTFVFPFLTLQSSAIYGYRAWGSMSVAERMALTNGGQLEFGRLSPASRGYVSEFLYRSGEDWESAGSQMLDSLDEFFDWSDASEDEEWDEAESEAKAREDDEITQILPNGPGPNAIISMAAFSKPAISTRLNLAGMVIPMSMPAQFFGMVKVMTEGGVDDMGPMPAFAFDGYRPGDLNGVLLSVQFLPEKKATLGLLGMTARPGTEFGSFDDLPKDLRDVVDKAYEKAKKMFGRGGGDYVPPPGAAK